MYNNTHYIRHIRGHYEIYDKYNNFLFSADTEQEAIQDLSKFIIESEILV